MGGGVCVSVCVCVCVCKCGEGLEVLRSLFAQATEKVSRFYCQWAGRVDWIRRQGVIFNVLYTAGNTLTGVNTAEREKLLHSLRRCLLFDRV